MEAIDNSVEAKVFCSIQLDRKGNVIDVLDSEGKSRKITRTDGPRVAVVGQLAPSGKKIKAVAAIEVVAVENEDHHDDPCWIRDSRGNWRCVCAPPLC